MSGGDVQERHWGRGVLSVSAGQDLAAGEPQVFGIYMIF